MQFPLLPYSHIPNLYGMFLGRLVGVAHDLEYPSCLVLAEE